MSEPELIFEWRIHPVAANPRRALGLLLMLTALALVTGLSFHSAFWALFCFAALAGSLHRSWLPTTYRIREQSLERQQAGFKTTRPWQDFKRAVLLQDAVFLSPFASPSRLDGHRGWLVQLPENKPDIADWIRQHVPVTPR